MIKGAPGRLIAGCCGLAAFAVAIIVGLSVDNPADVVLSRAILAMFGCYLVGAVVGMVSERAIDEALEAEFARQRPTEVRTEQVSEAEIVA